MGKKAKPEPLVILPSSIHTHTMILLHGRGSNAERFAFDQSIPSKLGILECKGSSGKTLPQLFPGMKFVFLTAPIRRSTARNRTTINIWFDNSSFIDPFEREETQVEGLAENFQHIAQIIQAEARTVPLRKVFLGGISQGCAMALHVLLGLTAERHCPDIRLGGFIGMSGWLPFQSAVNNLLLSRSVKKDKDGVEDPFALETEDGADLDKDNPSIMVTQFIREDIIGTLDYDKELLVHRCTPIFLGHGDQDDVVELGYGKDAMTTLSHMGLNVSWKTYKRHGHWYKVPDTIDDIVRFLEDNM
jgi:predicted esterase